MAVTLVTLSFLQRHRFGSAAGVLSGVVLALAIGQACVGADASTRLAMTVQAESSSAAGGPTSDSPQATAGKGLRLQGVRMSPLSRPRPGRLFTIRAGVSNESNEERGGLVLARVDRAPDLQAAVEVHIPAGESRMVDLRLRVPAQFAPGSTFDVSLSLNSLDGQRVRLTPSGQPQLDSLRMTINSDLVVTAVMLEPEPPHAPEWHWPHSDYLMSYECAIAARVDTGHERQTLSINQESFPTQLIDWDGLDAFVIARDGPLRDPVAMEAMGRWIASGGRAWIMLDKVGEDDVNVLLPDGMSCTTIDDIELNDFIVEANLVLALSEADRTVASDKPLRLRRVVQDGGTVTHRINGFPAAIWFTIGKGQLLVTTLDAAGWLKRRTSDPSTPPPLTSDFQLQVWAKPMVEQLYDGRESHSPIEVAEISYPLKHIGNPVLDRSFVISVVFGFCGLLAVAGWWCWQTGTLTRMGWLVPLISAAAAVPLLVASNRIRRDLPDTSAHLQVIEVEPGSRSIQGTQWTATYMSHSGSAELVADGDAIVSWPDTGQQNDLRRWLWDDYQHWRLSSTGWPHGLWRLNTRFSLQPRSLDAMARIDREGLSVQVPAELGEPLQDAVLCYVPGDVAVCNQIDVDRAVRVSATHGTLGESWLGSTIVNDEQARRDEIYRLLASRTSLTRYPSYPALLGWTKLWKVPASWSQPRDERGAALVLLPIQLQPVASGETVEVPHTVIRVETPVQGQSRSTAFANHTGLWREETTLPMQVPIRFHLPPQVCPIEASQILLDLQMRAPQRDVHIISLAGGKETVVAEFRSPLTAQRIRVTDPDTLADARDGSVDFRVDISRPIGQAGADLGAQVGNWQVDYFRMSVNGRVSDR